NRQRRDAHRPANCGASPHDPSSPCLCDQISELADGSDRHEHLGVLATWRFLRAEGWCSGESPRPYGRAGRASPAPTKAGRSVRDFRRTAMLPLGIVQMVMIGTAAQWAFAFVFILTTSEFHF